MASFNTTVRQMTKMFSEKIIFIFFRLEPESFEPLIDFLAFLGQKL